jgi:hypothetical protein
MARLGGPGSKDILPWPRQELQACNYLFVFRLRYQLNLPASCQGGSARGERAEQIGG